MRPMLLFALSLALPVAAMAKAPAAAAPKAVTATPQAAPVPQIAPAPASAPLKLTVTLKDGQQSEVTLKQYDSVFLSVVNARGTAFDLPWTEVASVSGDASSADLPLLKGHITNAPEPVGSQLAGKDPGTALAQAFWPGILLHGAGHRYAGDQDTFFSLAGGELFGLVVGGFGMSEVLGPDKTGESKDTAVALAAAGGAIFALTWLWDLGFAPGAARKTNQARGLALEPLPQGAQLAYRF